MTEVNGLGRQKGLKEHYHGTDYASDFINKIRVEVTVDGNQLVQAIEIIKNSANSGKIGDGKLFYGVT